MKKHFYIFRHGQTVWNAEGRPQGQHEYPVPLTMEGREQAQKLADKLKDKKIKTDCQLGFVAGTANGRNRCSGTGSSA